MSEHGHTHGHLFEVFVDVNADDGQIIEARINDVEIDDRVYCEQREAYIPLEENTSEWQNDFDATKWLGAALAFPQQVIAVFREWTGPDGYDINIMSDIAALLVKGGWVAEDDVIVEGEWPDDEDDEEVHE